MSLIITVAHEAKIRTAIATGYLRQFIGLFKFVVGILILVPRTSALGIIMAFPYTGKTVMTVAMPLFEQDGSFAGVSEMDRDFLRGLNHNVIEVTAPITPAV